MTEQRTLKLENIRDPRPGPDAETMAGEESLLPALQSGGESARRLAVLIQSFPPACAHALSSIVVSGRGDITTADLARACHITPRHARRLIEKARRNWRLVQGGIPGGEGTGVSKGRHGRRQGGVGHGVTYAMPDKEGGNWARQMER